MIKEVSMIRHTHTRSVFFRLCFLACSLFTAVLMLPKHAFAVAPASPIISSPASGSIHSLGDYITFAGSCEDAEDGSLPGASLSWVSSKDGPIGTGLTLSINSLQAGTHTITLIATDSESLSSSTSITIFIGNSPPTATITQPANNTTFSAGTAVTFAGSGTDPDGDTLSYSWTAYLGGTPTVIGSQSVISVSTLAVGTHVVILTVSDGTDSTESSPITVNITNNSPTATILSPSDGESFYPGDTINFNGDWSDQEDNSDLDMDFLWSCNEHGDLSTQKSFSSTTIPAGTHTITFEVTDSNGAPATQSVTIYVGNNDPTANIISPADGTSYNMGQTILFQGTGTDTEDGNLSGASLVWSSNLEGGTIGTGTTFTLDTLLSGTHVITLTVSDSFTTPGTGTDSVVITINNTFPTASISAPTDGRSFYPGTDITFSGIGNDAEDGALSGTSLVWSSSLSGQIGTGSPLTVNTLIEGDHIITLTATDSSGASTDSSTITITVGNTLPTVSLTAPTDGSTYNQGETITFRGTASDNEDGNLTGVSLTWTSSIDGLIGTGTILPVTTLSTGTHTITLTATDSQGETVSETIAVTVINSAPSITINTPPDGSIYEIGTAVTLSATVIDEEDGVLGGASLVWSSSLDGALGTGTSVANVILSKGSHVITLSATDSEGITATSSITIHIGNTPPTSTIISPLTGTNYEDGEYITFTGMATDDEDGTLTGTSLVWTSNVSGDFLTGASPAPINTLPTGRHVITLIATDSSGAVTYSDTVTIRVGNNDPVATILNPANYSVYESGETINFEGTGVDDEDGVLLGTSLVWTSNREGVIGTGTSLAIATLSAGQHTITLTVTDLDGATGTASITLKAQNATPVVTLSSPTTGSSFDEGNAILFQGTANDYEDGDLTGASLVWLSNLDGELGTGTNLSVDTLTSGIHTITFTATDNDGSDASQSISITIVPMTLSANTLSVAVGEEGTITIIGGKSPYRVATRRSQIALPSENNGEVIILGVSQGATIVTVTDNAKKSEEIYVTVTASTVGGVSTDLPDANAGPDQLLVTENSTVTLSGRNLNDPTGASTSFLWVQTLTDDPTQALSPATVTLSDARSATPSFTVPLADINGSTLNFQLTATTAQGSDTDQVMVTIADNGISDFPLGVITFKASTSRNMGIEMVENGVFTSLTILDPDDLGSSKLPQTMTYGLITMDIDADYAGATVIMIVHLPNAAPANATWFKYMPAQDTWVDFNRTKISNGTGDGAVFSSDRESITLYITDDGPYDDNPTDAKIQDPSGLGYAPLVDQEKDDDDGGGCFIGGMTP